MLLSWRYTVQLKGPLADSLRIHPSTAARASQRALAAAAAAADAADAAADAAGGAVGVCGGSAVSSGFILCYICCFSYNN